MVSLSNSSRFPANTAPMVVNPVMLPPGRAKLSTRPSATGSPPPKKTIGIVRVALLAARASFDPGRDQYVNLETDQLIRQGREPIELIISASVLESYVLTLNIANFTELSPERLKPSD